MLLNPKTTDYAHLDPTSRQIMHDTIAFFEAKGKANLKTDYHQRVWYSDFLDFVKEKNIFATLLTPPDHAGDNADARWDTTRNCCFNEILGFYGLAYWYTWQVTILGLGPIWMSQNAEIKEKAAQALKNGGIFAFGLSERTHGADLYSSEMVLTPLGDGRYVADGGKYYIGNANEAAMVSTFSKNSETDEYTWFIADPKHENYDLVKNVVEWQSYVAEYALNGYPVTDTEILTEGPAAWDAALNTVNVGKYNLGWASIGICTHSFYEAINHAAQRNLYGKFVTDFPHIQKFFVDAYARLTAMKMFAERTADYIRTASADDRRYLLYNPMVKMKVTLEGETVINLLWDIIAARGFEKDVYFESAASDIRALPKLEGTVHVNMALIVKFMANYFFNPDEFEPVPIFTEPVHDAFLFDQGPTRGLGKIRFHDYRIAYEAAKAPNAKVFREQIEVLRNMLLSASPDKAQTKDMGFLLNLGALFSLVTYGQLIIEKAQAMDLDEGLLDEIFDFMVRDFSEAALGLLQNTSTTDAQMACCRDMIRKPVSNPERFAAVWKNHVYALNNAYDMTP